MIRYFGIAFLLIVILSGCTRKSWSKSAIVEGYDCEWNSNNTYALCTLTRENEKGGLPITSYQVVSKEHEVVTSGTIGLGHIKWLNDDVVEIFETPGMIPNDFSPDDVARVYIISEGEYDSKLNYQKR